jgi:type I restriction enzyme S subunit
MKLAPYPDYKDSGVLWLGKIPAHWDVKPGMAFISQRKEKNVGMKESTVLSLSYGQIVIKPLEKLHGLVPESFETYQIADPGNIIIRGTDLQNDKTSLRVGKVRNRGIITSAYLCLQTNEKINPDYAHLLLHGYDLMKIYYGMGSGLRQNLDFSDFKRLPVLVPSPTEQSKIHKYVESVHAQINKFIRNKRRLIELLKEQKQNVINQAVTRGLDPKVKFKPSGVEWIGDIPEHWDATKLKRVVSFNPSKSETRANPADEEKVVFLPMENISVNGDIDCSEKRTLSEVWNGFTYFRRGDVVVAKITPCFENGKGAYLKGLESDFGFGTTELIVLRPSKAIDGAFLRFLTSTKQFLLLGEQYMTGAAGQQRIPSDFVKNYPIGLPPIEEQLEILEHIQEKSAEIDQAISRAQREIELMREYRTRLISDVVTGQVDVRGIEVPEVVEEELLSLDEDTGEADDVIDDEGDMDETD